MQSQEYLKREFVYFISDTVALLGGDVSLVSKIRECMEKPFTEEMINEVKVFNGKQIDALKTRLSQLETSTITKT